MDLFDSRDRESPLLLGVVHLRPLPGAPRFGGAIDEVLQAARRDAVALEHGGCDAIIVENFGDVPFLKDRVEPETVAAMTRAILEVREAVGELPLGVNVLRNDARAALGICAATGAEFIRVNVHTGVYVTDQGQLEGRAAETLRERARFCPDVRILADVHVKHASSLGSETAAEAALDAVQRGLADGLILTGSATGRPPSREVLAHVRRHISSVPLLVGSGVSDSNGKRLLESTDGAIVGSWFKSGELDAPVDAERVARLRRVLDS